MDPWQLPREFMQTTWNRFVSMACPGPTISSHQPGEGSDAEDRAWDPGESPVQRSTTLSRAGASSPQVS